MTSLFHLSTKDILTLVILFTIVALLFLVLMYFRFKNNDIQINTRFEIQAKKFRDPSIKR